MGNQTLIFTCLRNDTAVYDRDYVAMTDAAGYYHINVTYGPYNAHVERQGYQTLDDDSLVLQQGANYSYNVSLRPVVVSPTAGANLTQAVVATPGSQASSDNTMIYVVLGIVNVLALLLIAFVIIRARK